MGYKGVDTTEAVFEGHRISADQILGGEPGKGFYQMMDGVEVGRVNVAARATGVANRAFELGIAYAQQRRRSASRSPSTRRSCSGSRRWRPRSRPRTR
jgi:alkylation response protein AidB-like acyl-CoA dehydrogenase